MLSRLHGSALPYLILAATAVIGGQFLDYFTYWAPFFKGQSLGLIFTLVLTGGSVLVWLFLRGRHFMHGAVMWALLSMLLLWAWAVVHAHIDGAAFNYSAFAAPVIVLLVLQKPPNQAEASRIIDVVMSSFTVAIVAVQCLHWVGIRQFRMDITSRWSLPLPGLDLDARWEGMFGDPNNAGLIGALLLTFALHRSGYMRALLGTLGALVVLLSDSRTALLAVGVGVLVRLLTSNWYRTRQVPTLITVSWVSALLAASAVAVLVVDSSFNGRTYIWSAFLGLAREQPFTGIGWEGIDQASREGVIPWHNADGHNIVLDTLTRHGVVPALIVVALIYLSCAASWAAHAVDDGLSLSIVLVTMVAALTYTITSWQYLGVLILPLFCALLLAHAVVQPRISEP